MSLQTVADKADDEVAAVFGRRPSPSRANESAAVGQSESSNSKREQPTAASSRTSRTGSMSEFPREGSEEAPAGCFEVVESDQEDEDGDQAIDRRSSYSERSTPPYLRWAVDLQNVLEDFEGLQLFKKYLINEGCANELDFWYACKGLKQYPEKDRALIERVAHMVHQNYVRPQGEFSLSCIRGETRMEIQKKFVSKDVSQTMFDGAQQEVEAFLRIKHAAFVESDLYISYLQVIQTGGWDSPKCYSNESRENTSSNSSDAQPAPAASLLPTVHEENESDSFDRHLAKSPNHPQSSAVVRTAASGKEKPSQRAYPIAVGAEGQKDSSATGLASSTVVTPSVLVPSDIVSAAPARKKSSSQIGSRLTPGALVATLEQRMAYSACRGSRSGVPPNPYHTKYVPYLPTSAQDSELQSMSSDATTEASLSNSRYRHRERRLMRQHIEHNRDPIANQIFIPRTQREVVARDMMDDEFKIQVVEKLEHVRRERETYEKLNESLQRLSEPENNSNSHRAAVEKFCKVEKSFRAAPEDAEAILDDYYTRVGWKDSPKQSPMRSPGFAYGGRRKSPISKSPDCRAVGRLMTTSYPLPYAMSAQTLPVHHHRHHHHHHPSGVSVLRTPSSSASSQEAHQLIQVPPIPIHLLSKHRFATAAAQPTCGSAAAMSQQRGASTIMQNVQQQRASSFSKSSKPQQQQQQQQQQPQQQQQQMVRFPLLASDTSGISSGTSSDPSLVSAKIQPSSAISGCGGKAAIASEQWILDERQVAYDGSDRHRMRLSNPSGGGGGGVVSTTVGGRAYKGGSHKMVGSESTQKSSSSRSHKSAAADTASYASGAPLSSRKASSSSSSSNCRNSATSSGGIVVVGGAGGGAAAGQSSQEYISVGYFLPNESTPYVTRFAGRQITLRQFKQLIPRKGNFRYFFQCASDELGTGMIQKEVTEENELLPIWEGNKIVAKIVCVD